jgi:hypothetical protein
VVYCVAMAVMVLEYFQDYSWLNIRYCVCAARRYDGCFELKAWWG